MDANDNPNLDLEGLHLLYEFLLPYFRDNRFETRSPECRERLTRALLHREFGVNWWLPTTVPALVPILPDRVKVMRAVLHKVEEAKTGYDLGCGYNGVYTILGAAMAGIVMTGVDIDKRAVRHLRQIIRRNTETGDLKSDNEERNAFWDDPVEPLPSGGKRAPEILGQCHILHINNTLWKDCSNEKLICLGCPCPHEYCFDFLVCNPPFLRAEDRTDEPMHRYRRNYATNEELYFPGGDVVFISELITEAVIKPKFARIFAVHVASAVSKSALEFHIAELNKEKKTLKVEWLDISSRDASRTLGCFRSLLLFSVIHYSQ